MEKNSPIRLPFHLWSSENMENSPKVVFVKEITLLRGTDPGAEVPFSQMPSLLPHPG
jgi:hypothetical protein